MKRLVVSLGMAGVLLTTSGTAALMLLSLVYGGITFQQPIMFAVCLDIGAEYAGAVTGIMNMAAQLGAFLSSVVFGYLVQHFGSYHVPFYPMLGFLILSAVLWLKIDPARKLAKS